MKGRELKKRISELSTTTEKAKIDLDNAAFHIPNNSHPSTPPKGQPPSIVCQFGEKPKFDYSFRNHLDIVEDLDLCDFAAGAKVAGRSPFSNFGSIHFSSLSTHCDF